MNLFVKRKINIPRSKFYPTATLFEKAGQQFLSQRERKREQVAPRVCNCRLAAAELGRAEMRFFSSLPRYIYIYIYPDSFDRLRQKRIAKSVKNSRPFGLPRSPEQIGVGR